MLRWFVLLWICLEVAGFIWVGEWIGLGWTLLLIIASILVGIVLLRREGLRAANIMMQKMRTGEAASAEDFIDTPFVMVGALLLIVPGFFSDILGLLCFLPPVRQYFVKLLGRLTVRDRRRYKQHTSINAGRTFEGEYQKKDEPRE